MLHGCSSTLETPKTRPRQLITQAKHYYIRSLDNDPGLSQVCLEFALDVLDLRHGALVRVALMQKINVLPQTRTLLLGHPRTAFASVEGERHQDIGRSKLSAAKILTRVWRCLKL